jgi:hypothetical protein
MNKPTALLFAVLGTTGLAGISIAISYRSMLGIVLSIIGFCVVMAIGFAIKRRKKST